MSSSKPVEQTELSSFIHSFEVSCNATPLWRIHGVDRVLQHGPHDVDILVVARSNFVVELAHAPPWIVRKSHKWSQHCRTAITLSSLWKHKSNLMLLETEHAYETSGWTIVSRLMPLPTRLYNTLAPPHIQRSKCKGVLDESNLLQSKGPSRSATLAQNEDKTLRSPKVKMKKLKQLMYLPDGQIEKMASLSRSLCKLSRSTRRTLYLTLVGSYWSCTTNWSITTCKD